MPDPSPVGFSITSTPDATTVGASASPDGAVERPDRTVRIVLVADLAPGGPARPLRAVAPAELDAFLAETAPRVELSVTLGDAPPVPVVFAPQKLSDFEPDRLAAALPPLARLEATRAAVADLAAGRLAPDALAARLDGVVSADEAQALAETLTRADAPAAPAGDGTIDRILGLVADGGDTAPQTDRDRLLDALGAAASEPGGADRSAAARLAETLGTRLQTALAAVRADPDLRRLEAAWRGLRFVLDRVGRGSDLVVEVLAAGRDTLAERVYQHVLLPEHAGRATPLVAVVVDHAFGPTPPDVAALTDLAETGASLQVPVITSAAPEAFGLEGAAGWSRMPPARQAMARPEAIGLAKLRQRPEAPFLALAAPAFLLRDSLPGSGGGAPDDRLWGGAALLAAAALAVAQREVREPAAVGGRAVTGLPVRQTRMGALPLAAAWSESTLGGLADQGIWAFSGPLNTDRAVAGRPVVFGAARTAGTPDEAAPSLPGALYAAVAAHAALRAGQALAGTTPEAATHSIRRMLEARFGEGTVDANPLPDHESLEAHVVGVRVTPPRTVMASGDGVVIGVEIPKEAP